MARSKNRETDTPREQEKPAHRLRREFRERVESFTGVIEEDDLEAMDEDEFDLFELAPRRQRR